MTCLETRMIRTALPALLLLGCGGGASTEADAPGSSVLSLVVDTGQEMTFDAMVEIAPPAFGQPFYGQDAQFSGSQPSYSRSEDGLTVFDNVTGLTWQRSPDTSGDGSITASDKMSWSRAQARPAVLNAARFGGYTDWRLPTIKEL